MRIFLLSFIFIIFLGCSFDNKSGIWKNESKIITENNDEFSQFKDLVTTNSPFKKELKIKDNLSLVYQTYILILIGLIFFMINIIIPKILN